MRIVLCGTGNLATRLGIALFEADADIVQVFGRTEKNAAELAHILQCAFTLSPEELITDADLYILAVSDDSIEKVVSNLAVKDQLVVHTAGSVSMAILAASAKNFGVLYPLQTFSKNKEVDFRNIPICIEANNARNLEILHEIASTIAEQVVRVDSNQRKQLHLAAVFVCNFVNHFYSIGEKLLIEQQLDFDLLKPLIRETAEKAMLHSPALVQTGPAVRGDKAVMEMHRKILEGHPEWLEIYTMISKDIEENRHKI